jgi:hypothetical protein
MPSARQVFSASIVLMLGFVAAAFDHGRARMGRRRLPRTPSASSPSSTRRTKTPSRGSRTRSSSNRFAPQPGRDSEVRLRDQQGVGPAGSGDGAAVASASVPAPALLQPVRTCRSVPRAGTNLGIVFDYNRVDEVRTGSPTNTDLDPAGRRGSREESNTRRASRLAVRRPGRAALHSRTASRWVSRRSARRPHRAQQVSNIENSLALLLGRRLPRLLRS